MSRSDSRPGPNSRSRAHSGIQPVSLEQYMRETRESCRDGRCSQDEAAIAAAYERYINDPQAPWNKTRRR